MKKSFSNFLTLFKNAFSGWQKDKATVWCAALAYFTVFSIGPLLLLIISIVGLIATKTSFEHNIYQQLRGLFGNKGADIIQTIVTHAQKPSTSVLGSVIGTIILLLGAAGLFGQLQEAMNTIWGVTQKPKSGILPFIINRLINFSMIGVIAFLLLVSLIASTAIAAFGSYITHFLPFSPIILEVINFVISFFLTTLLFAIVMKVLPDVKIAWKNVWVGAVITALLFTIGKAVIGIYIGHSGAASEYGAAGSLVVLLLWVYYSSQILFFGTELTKSYALLHGEEIIPSKYAVVTAEDQNQTRKNSQYKKAQDLAAEIGRGFANGMLTEFTEILRGKKSFLGKF